MAIDNPDLFDRPIASRTGSLTAASQIERTDGANVEDDLTALETSTATINATLAQINNFGIAWNYDDQLTEDPPFQTFRFNNADPTLVTTIYLDKFSAAGRFDELLEGFASGGFIYLQDRTSTSNNFLYRTTSAITPTGGGNGWFVVPVEYLRSQSTLTAVNGDRFTLIFIPITGTGGRSVPNMFLNEIEEVDRNSFTNRVDVPADSSFVRFWLRPGIVTTSNVSTPGQGLVISEANGVLADNGPTFRQGSNDSNVYLYVTLPDAFVSATDLNTLYLIIKDDEGNIVDEVAFNSNFTFQSDIDGVVSGMPYLATSGLNGGSLLHYFNNWTLELFYVTVDRFFDISEANAPNVDLTRAIRNLKETQLDGDAQAKLNFQHRIPDDDQFKLDQFVEQSTTSTSAAITGSETVYYKQGSFVDDATDYFTTDFDTGLPPSFDSSTTWLVVAPHNHDITSLQGLESGTGTVTNVKDDVSLTGATGSFNIYRSVVPATTSATNFFVFVGTTNTISEIDASSLVKFGSDNLTTELANRIDASPAISSFTPSEGLADLNSHITVAGIPNPTWTTASNPTPHRNAVITRQFAALWDENQRTGASPGNYFDDLADPSIVIPSQNNIHFFSDVNDPDNRFPGKKSWVDSTIQVQGAPLTNNFQKIIAFSALVPSTFDGNVVLFQAGPDSGQRVLRVRQENGTTLLQARRGNRDGATETHVVFRYLTPLNTDEQTAHWVGNAANSTDFRILASDPIPAGGFLVQVRRYLNGSLTSGESFTQNITDRDTDVSAVTTNLFSNELEVTHSYDADFDDNGTLVDIIRLSTNNVANANVSYIAQVRYAVDETVQQSSTSQFETINTVTLGTEIDVVFIFEKENALNQNANAPLQLKINVNGISDNDVALALGANTFDFSDLRFGDTADCLISNIQVYSFTAPSFFDFPTHSVIAAFYSRRNEWLGLFRHPDLASRNYTIDGGMILTDEDATTFDIIERFKAIASPEVFNVFEATSTANQVASVVLPTNYTNYNFVHITERDPGPPVEWRHATIPVPLLEYANLGSGDNIRLQGNTDLNWTVGTRTLALAGAATEIWKVTLINIATETTT